MKNKFLIFCIFSVSFIFSAFQRNENVTVKQTDSDTIVLPGEKHFKNMKMLTAEGNDNAEAYFSFDGSKIIFQSTRAPYECDQIYMMNVDGTDQHMVNSGKGRTTCSYFFSSNSTTMWLVRFMIA